jgi:hypothetical protein
VQLRVQHVSVADHQHAAERLLVLVVARASSERPTISNQLSRPEMGGATPVGWAIAIG